MSRAKMLLSALSIERGIVLRVALPLYKVAGFFFNEPPLASYEYAGL